MHHSLPTVEFECAMRIFNVNYLYLILNVILVDAITDAELYNIPQQATRCLSPVHAIQVAPAALICMLVTIPWLYTPVLGVYSDQCVVDPGF